MNEKQRASWERDRSRGVWRFVLQYGLLLWGGGTLAGTLFVERFVDGREIETRFLLFRVVFTLVSGMLFALVIWLIGGSAYKKLP